MSTFTSDLWRRWYALFMRNHARPEILSPEWARLRLAYEDESRAYHNLEHIAKCLNEFELFRPLANNPDEVVAAIFFHDVVYDTRAKDNEVKSAEYARTALRAMRMPDAFIDNVIGLIMATTHSGGLTKPDEQLIADIDLSGIGHAWWSFKADSIYIRQEYRSVPEAEFNKERARILQIFRDRKPLYYLKPFRDKFEMRAKSNLARAITELRA